LKASDVMTREVITAAPDMSLEEAARLMIHNRISGLPVMRDGRLVGIVTEGDVLRRKELGTEPGRSGWLAALLDPGGCARDYVRGHARKVGELMTRDVCSVAPNTPVPEIVTLMESRHIKRLPVVDRSGLVGIVARADLLRGLADVLRHKSGVAISDAQIRQRVLDTIEGQSWAPRANIDVRVKNGMVELVGTVPDERERAALNVIAENADGAKGVNDELVCVEPISGLVVDDASNRISVRPTERL